MIGEDGRKHAGAIGRPVIGQHAGDGNAAPGEVAQGAAEKTGGDLLGDAVRRDQEGSRPVIVHCATVRHSECFPRQAMRYLEVRRGASSPTSDGQWRREIVLERTAAIPIKRHAMSTEIETSAPGSPAPHRAHMPAPAASAEPEVPPPAAMMGLVTGYWISQAVGAVARLGVADRLVGAPRDSDDIARDVGADPQALYRVLRLLASVGVFAEVGPRRFGLTALGETLRSDAPGSVRDFAITETAPGHWLPWGRFAESVQSGRPMAREALGLELFDWFAQNPEEASVFSAAMGNLSALAAGELVRVYDFSRTRTVADVGGAHGVMLAAILRANPTARGILFDMPHVIATATDAIEAQNLSARVDLRSGDFFDVVPEGADVHLLKQILHDWDDERDSAATQLSPRARPRREAADHRDGRPFRRHAESREGDGSQHARPARGARAHRARVPRPSGRCRLPAGSSHSNALALQRDRGNADLSVGRRLTTRLEPTYCTGREPQAPAPTPSPWRDR